MSQSATADAQGYITDIAYTIKYYARQSPGHMITTAQATGLEAFSDASSFAYADFGCGRGMTLMALAAVYPEAQFFGVDVNAEHIAEARERAAAAGLNNLTFHAKGFDGLAKDDLPDLDMATAHGVYSWVSPAVRLQLRDCMARHLKPEGLALLSYNVQAGYAGLQPVQSLLMHLAQVAPGDQTAKRRAALATVKRMRATEQDFFERYPKAAAYIDEWGKHDETYLFHEYFNEHWNPLTFGQVAQEMAAVDLHFCGDAVYPSWVGGKGKKSRAPWMNDPVLLEDMASFATTQAFRYDLYARCGSMSFARPPVISDDTQFILAHPPSSGEVKKAAERTWLPARLVKHLMAGPQRYCDLKEAEGFAGKGERLLFTAIRAAMAQGLVARVSEAVPSVPPAEAPGGPLTLSTKLAELLLQDKKLAKQTLPLPAPTLGGAVHVPPMISAVVAEVVSGGETDLAERVAERVHGLTGTDAGGNKRETLEAVRERVPGTLERYRTRWLPFLYQTGVVKADPAKTST
ncbi:MAG: class I SAM-dependent methyltransferase [Pseudomonadota bacterium]